MLLAKSFLENCTQEVVVNRKRSSNNCVNVGVPQGTISGPIFWLVFVDDLQPEMNSIKYADDATCYAPINIKNCTFTVNTSSEANFCLNTNIIQEALTYSQEWCLKNSMILNATKTKILNLSVKTNFKLQTHVH